MNKHVAVAISGGIDSLYSAFLLKKSGYDVTGIHFTTGYEIPVYPEKKPAKDALTRITWNSSTSVAESTVLTMAAISEQLDIPVHIIDISEQFTSEVVNYFVDGYRRDITPSPCLKCNPSIKFGSVLNYALTFGADLFATGHYVRTKVGSEGQVHLLKGIDTTKDQSYFLAFLSSEQLQKSLFPLGDMTKKSVVQQARLEGLTPVSNKESQDVCFISGNYKSFLATQPGFESHPGPVITIDGTVVGKHTGLSSYTIGQRRGINCPGPYPYYVLRLDTESNTLVVGSKSDLLADSCIIETPHWINNEPEIPTRVFSRIRYSHKGIESTVDFSDNTWNIRFDEPVSSVTPGQGAVFYSGDEVLGGAWITGERYPSEPG